ncbi:MAG: hypothetical protein MHM6MM_005854 [Cercozoa sp. M6MM]
MFVVLTTAILLVSGALASGVVSESERSSEVDALFADALTQFVARHAPDKVKQECVVLNECLVTPNSEPIMPAYYPTHVVYGLCDTSAPVETPRTVSKRDTSTQMVSACKKCSTRLIGGVTIAAASVAALLNPTQVRVRKSNLLVDVVSVGKSDFVAKYTRDQWHTVRIDKCAQLQTQYNALSEEIRRLRGVNDAIAQEKQSLTASMTQLNGNSRETEKWKRHVKQQATSTEASTQTNVPEEEMQNLLQLEQERVQHEEETVQQQEELPKWVQKWNPSHAVLPNTFHYVLCVLETDSEETMLPPSTPCKILPLHNMKPREYSSFDRRFLLVHPEPVALHRLWLRVYPYDQNEREEYLLKVTPVAETASGNGSRSLPVQIQVHRASQVSRCFFVDTIVVQPLSALPTPEFRPRGSGQAAQVTQLSSHVFLVPKKLWGKRIVLKLVKALIADVDSNATLAVGVKAANTELDTISYRQNMVTLQLPTEATSIVVTFALELTSQETKTLLPVSIVHLVPSSDSALVSQMPAPTEHLERFLALQKFMSLTTQWQWNEHCRVNFPQGEVAHAWLQVSLEDDSVMFPTVTLRATPTDTEGSSVDVLSLLLPHLSEEQATLQALMLEFRQVKLRVTAHLNGRSIALTRGDADTLITVTSDQNTLTLSGSDTETHVSAQLILLPVSKSTHSFLDATGSVAGASTPASPMMSPVPWPTRFFFRRPESESTKTSQVRLSLEHAELATLLKFLPVGDTRLQLQLQGSDVVLQAPTEVSQLSITISAFGLPLYPLRLILVLEDGKSSKVAMPLLSAAQFDSARLLGAYRDDILLKSQLLEHVSLLQETTRHVSDEFLRERMTETLKLLETQTKQTTLAHALPLQAPCIINGPDMLIQELRVQLLDTVTHKRRTLRLPISLKHLAVSDDLNTIYLTGRLLFELRGMNPLSTNVEEITTIVYDAEARALTDKLAQSHPSAALAQAPAQFSVNFTDSSENTDQAGMAYVLLYSRASRRLANVRTMHFHPFVNHVAVIYTSPDSDKKRSVSLQFKPVMSLMTFDGAAPSDVVTLLDTDDANREDTGASSVPATVPDSDAVGGIRWQSQSVGPVRVGSEVNISFRMPDGVASLHSTPTTEQQIRVTDASDLSQLLQDLLSHSSGGCELGFAVFGYVNGQVADASDFECQLPLRRSMLMFTCRPQRPGTLALAFRVSVQPNSDGAICESAGMWWNLDVPVLVEPPLEATNATNHPKPEFEQSAD